MLGLQKLWAFGAEFPFALDCGIRNLIAENDNQIVITAILNQNRAILVDSSHSEVSILWCQSGNASIKDRVLAITMDESALMCLGNGTRDDDEVS
ncbi:unnamed protein product [Vicia faba]|uniref:RNase H type-1 domain-containing protein n=1 Tax=Vicia faba TaxID=3906 RepID=A0AAV1B847_VICFA|nr:unnamed protein product [Vicia faba]